LEARYYNDVDTRYRVTQDLFSPRAVEIRRWKYGQRIGNGPRQQTR